MGEKLEMPELFVGGVKSVKINSKKVLRDLVKELLEIDKYLVGKKDTAFKRVEILFKLIIRHLKASIKGLAQADYENLYHSFGEVMKNMVEIFKKLPLDHELRDPLNDLYAYITVFYKLASKVFKKVQKAKSLISHLDIKDPEQLRAKNKLEVLLTKLKSTKEQKVRLKSVEVGKNAKAVRVNRMMNPSIIKNYKQKQIEELDHKLVEFGNLISENDASKVKSEVQKIKIKDEDVLLDDGISELIKSKFSVEDPNTFKEQFQLLFGGSLDDKMFKNFVGSLSSEEGKLISGFVNENGVTKSSKVLTEELKKWRGEFKKVISEIRSVNRTKEVYKHKNPV